MALKRGKTVCTVLNTVAAVMVILFLAKMYTNLKRTNLYLRMLQKDHSHVKQQRDLLSKILNDAKKFRDQKRCMERQMNVSNNNGSEVWCTGENSPKSKYPLFDATLAEALWYFLLRQSVAIFGDGHGLYKKFMDRRQHMATDAYDGAPFIENATGGHARYMDLTVPQYGLPVYDWVVCLEAAEYVPKKYESIFVSNIVRHARLGVVLSWAETQDTLLNGENLKSPDDIDQIMFEYGFDLDGGTSDLLRRVARFPRFKENLRVYTRQLISPINVDDY